MQFKKLVRILKKRFPYLVVTIVLVMSGHLVAMQLERDTYEARAKLLQRFQWYVQEYTGVRGMVLRTEAQMKIATQQALLLAAPVFEEAARVSRALEILEKKGLDTTTTRAEDAANVLTEENDPILQRENLRAAAARIRAGAATTRPTQDLIEVIFIGESEIEAIRNANAMAIAAEYINRQKARVDVDPSLTKIDTKIERNETRMKELKSALDKIEENENFLDFNEKLKEILNSLSQLNERENAIRSRLDQLDKEISSRLKLRGFSENLSRGAGEQPPLASPEIGDIQARIRKVNEDLSFALTKYNPDSPAIKELKSRLTWLQSELEREVSKAVSEEISGVVAKQLALQAELDSITGDRERKRAQMKEFREVGTEYMPLRDEYEELKSEASMLSETRRTLNNLRTLEAGYFSLRELASSASPRPKTTTRATLFVVVAALLAGIGVIYLLEYFDTTIATEHDVRRHLNLPVLAIIPEIKDTTCIMAAPIVSPLVEIYSTTAALLVRGLEEQSRSVILVSSSVPREGKTTVSINLAVALARQNYTVTLVDSDLRNPSIHHFLSLDNSYGLTTIIEQKPGEPPSQRPPGWLDEDGRVRTLPTTVANLSVLPCGPKPADPPTFIRSQAMRHTIAQLKSQCDFVIMDSAPLFVASDPVLLSSVVDGVLLVVGSELVDRHRASWSKHLLTNAQANIIGVILNRSRIGRPTEYYCYYYYERTRERV